METILILLLLLLLGSLSTWRLTYMLIDETGPFAVFEHLRAKIFKLEFTHGGIRDAFSCFYCLSVWVALFWLAMALVSPIIFFILTLPLSMSAIAVFINIVHTRIE